MKQRRSKAEAPAPVAPKRVRKEGLPKSRRTFITMSTPDMPRPAAVDASPPLMGQRKRKPARRPKLSPNPVSV